MGLGYHIFPVTQLDEESVSWLEREIGLAVPKYTGTGGFPTPNEFKEVLSRLSEYEVIYSQNENDLNIEIDRRLTVWVNDYYPEQNDNKPHKFYFYRGDSDLVIEVLERLTLVCGPFVVSDGGNYWAAVVEGTSLPVRWYP